MDSGATELQPREAAVYSAASIILMNRSIARKIKKTSHINLATENMQISGLRRRRV